MKGRDLLIGAGAGAVIFAVLASHHAAKTPARPVRLSSTASAQATQVAHTAPVVPVVPVGSGGGISYLSWAIGAVAVLALILSFAALISARRRRQVPFDTGLSEVPPARVRLEPPGDGGTAADWSAQIGELREQTRKAHALAEQAGAASRATAEGTTELVRRLRTEVQEQLASHMATLRTAIDELAEKISGLDSRLTESAGESAELRRRWLDDHHDLADRLADISSDVAYLDRHLAPVEQAVRQQLSPGEGAGVGAGAGAGIGLAGAFSTGQTAAAEGLRQLYLDLCRALRAEISYTEPAADGAARFLLSWTARAGGQPVPLLAGLLRACADPDASPRPGLNELRGLLLGLHCAAPAGAELGPLSVSSTERHLFAAVTEAAGDDGFTVDLTTWAREFAL